jgi:radical SAM superfamily enzyme YgiQ (UPF0313 family)
VGELLRRTAARPGLDEIPVACFSAFDSRTRVLPFLFYDTRMAPAGLRSIAAAFHEAGFTRTRAIFQLWSPNIVPFACRIDGKPLGVMAVSALQIHSQPSYDLIADAWSMGENRPLILAGGPKAIFQPDHYFGLGPNGDIHADVACTGEELILIELLDRVTEHRGRNETMLAAFRRCRDAGLLNDLPGLVYMSRERDSGGRPVLIHTGVQRLVRDMDELPHAQVGFRLLERPHRGRGLSPQPLPADRVHIHSHVAALVTTHGCRFGCPYCPITAYNQRTWRYKSPERLADEIKVMREEFNIRYIFGTDDNFFNDRKTAEGMLAAMARTQFMIGGVSRPAKRSIRFSTEATQADVVRNMDLLPLAREAGTWALWFGIEDLSATLVNKGQTAEKTTVLFREMTRHRIMPAVMMMYYDGQPLRTGGNNLYGLLNQARFLFNAGAATYQCTLHSPCVGAKEYDATLNSGTMLRDVDGTEIPDAFFDGNRVLASSMTNPAIVQKNMLRAYWAFYNPLNLIRLLVTPGRKDPLRLKRAVMQVIGLLSLAITVVKNIPWINRLGRGRYRYWQTVPPPKFTVRRLDEAIHKPSSASRAPAKSGV